MRKNEALVIWFACVAIIALCASAINRKVNHRLAKMEESIGNIAVKAYCAGYADGKKDTPESRLSWAADASPDLAITNLYTFVVVSNYIHKACEKEVVP